MSEPIKKIKHNPESYSPKVKPAILSMAEGCARKDGMNLPSSAKVPFSGAIDSEGPELVSHTRAFASAMMSLTVLMGVPHDIRIIHEHNMDFRADYDYFRYLLVSGEGFLFWQDTWNYITHELPQGPGPYTWESWGYVPENAEPILDCFKIAGIMVELYSNYPIDSIKGGWTSDNMLKEMTMRNLTEGFPVLLFGGDPGDRIILAIGYHKDGDSLVAWTFSAGDDKRNKSFAPEKCTLLSNWTDNVVAAALVKSIPQTPTDIKFLLRKALIRGVEFLRQDNRLEKFRETFNGSGKARVHPEIWDLAERRAYLAKEMERAAEIFETDKLITAIDACNKIHDNMWRINALSKSKNNALNDTTVKKQIADILGECRQLDLIIANTISQLFID